MPVKKVRKQSKLGSLFSKLNPNSPKKKLMLFVLVFAVLGGGYYAYSSFAATGTHIVTVAYQPYFAEKGAIDGVNLKTVEIANGKGTAKALWVKKGKWAKVWTNKTVQDGKQYQACWSVYNKSSDNEVSLQIEGYNDGHTGLFAGDIRNVNASDKIQNKCLSFTPIGTYTDVRFSYIPNDTNGIVYKVTLVKL